MKEVMIWLRCSYNSVMYVEVSDGNKTRVLKKSLSNLISKEQSIRSCSGHHASQALSNQRQRIEKNKSTTPKRSKSKHKRLPLGMGTVPSLGVSASVWDSAQPPA